MRSIVISILLLIFTFCVYAQNVTNVRVYQDGEDIIITYDLDKKATISVWVATGQSNQYTELKAVTGNVGNDVSAGVNKQIIWQPLQEQNEFVARNVRFKVAAKPDYYFSVSATKKVAFSPGNLQYTRSTHTWSFAEHQYYIIGEANGRGHVLADKIDLFGWSGSMGSAQWGISTSQSNLDYSGDFVDWGTNTIGTDAPNTWRTLTYIEWYYLRYTRTDANNLIGIACINLNADGSKYADGLILLPDNWTCPVGVTFKSGFASETSVQAYADYQTLTLSDWQSLEATGAVFLPVSGDRDGACVYNVLLNGYYWSATPLGSDDAYCLNIFSGVAYTFNYDRYIGRSVRLVQDLD